MNLCAITGKVLPTSVHLDERRGELYFTVTAPNGDFRYEPEPEYEVPCVILDAPIWIVEHFKNWQRPMFIELQGRVKHWKSPTKRKVPRFAVVVDANSVEIN